MIVIGAAILGVLIGALTARRRGGRLADILQYAAGYGIAFTLLGLFATIVIERLAA
ncbi:apolipoprotein acyltransferase [Neotabrizicola shimadae]|uniref:Apolipoprotein acyltransferase n=1 Tax=Neotabrizicola shimadae TaxID=2807096 RepID=A0A8G1EER1_9RHOB|nr:apolipoprotein acyltransferase [Neotabrizicola shimadae]QYZ71623.1 apolipoprotein acyltransferase [Neotabrizicola shimadae]